MPKAAHKALVEAALRLVAKDELGLEDAGKAIGVSHNTVARWKNGNWKRLSDHSERALAKYLKGKGLDAAEISRVSRENGDKAAEMGGGPDVVLRALKRIHEMERRLAATKEELAELREMILREPAPSELSEEQKKDQELLDAAETTSPIEGEDAASAQSGTPKRDRGSSA